MRDAFGGAFMIKVFIVFIFIYICFTAIALNYAKAFKVKNKIIDYLEENEIVDLANLTINEQEAMEEFINNEIYGNMNYHVNVENMCSGMDTTDALGKVITYCNDIGIFIKQSGYAENTEGVYYTVSTYAGWNAGFINKILQINNNNADRAALAGYWKISGETRLIVNK